MGIKNFYAGDRTDCFRPGFAGVLAKRARPGVMRDWVLQNADVIVSDFHPEQLRQADEIFLTNSRYGIAPIRTLNGLELPSKSRGAALRQTYLQHLETLA